ncbi:hypothetical protein AMATHDRAFT_194065 [Amanita thiersii Skay4041]|uniref:Rad4 beta-hairpin domain-containing protein n=1 Tax=Amanita thiersii Skay4041 TaxID=703135 RepID=A0A2A9NQK1_9AGAR|nr:hypothetical protein AMATHDRAFT_194065 [Amanita thiersii Skay4041]
MDSEDDFDWEEVPVPEHEHHIEITLQAHSKPEAASKKRIGGGISHAERLRRVDCHKIHTIVLLANAQVRNKWLNDPLLHARLLSLTPLNLQNGFAMIHKSRVPDQNQRGRMFEAAIRSLTEWWTDTFFDVLPEGHLRSRTYDDIQGRLIAEGLVSSTPPEPQSTSSSSTPPDETAIALFLTSNLTFPDEETLQDILDDDGERIRGPKSLMKHALMRCGSRDTSAQLFTALCRALGIPARLVVSLQSVPWRAKEGRPKPKYPKKVKNKGKAKQVDEEGSTNGQDDEEENEDDMEEVVISTTPAPSSAKGKGKATNQLEPFPGSGRRVEDDIVVETKSEKSKGKQKARPPIKLRKQRSKGRGSPSGSGVPSRPLPPNPMLIPPVFWTEVFSRPDGRWIPVDPIRCFVNKRKVFDPTPITSALGPASSHANSPFSGTSTPTGSTVRQENRMVYVLAFEEDGYARDVTRRYAREYSTKVAKAQGLSVTGGGGKGRQIWWERVVASISRPYRLHRDDIEDEELEIAQLTEGMPTTLAGFKDHPLYVLTRHLKQNETIHPPPPDTPELGKFRGEPVYPRSAVVSLKTAENWMRSEGRSVRPGCQPLKLVKFRAGTINKMRELEMLREAGSSAQGSRQNEGVAADGDAGGSEIMQGLYSRSQTELYIPDPVVDGKVPKNNFGNIDLYVPSMLPKGAVHVPFRGVAKIARKLGFDFAEAVTGFEFKKRRAFPVIEGVVIARENESALLEAFWEAEKTAEEKARAKRKDQAIKRWTRLIQGLRIRQRLQEQYRNAPTSNQEPEEVKTTEERNEELTKDEDGSQPDPEPSGSGGGFLVEAGDVVQSFSLPRYQHVNLPFDPIPHKPHKQPTNTEDKDKDGDDDIIIPEYITYDIQPMEVDEDNTAAQDDSSSAAAPGGGLMPKTMQELAEEAAAAKKHVAEGISPSPEAAEDSFATTKSGPDNRKNKNNNQPSMSLRSQDPSIGVSLHRGTALTTAKTRNKSAATGRRSLKRPKRPDRRGRAAAPRPPRKKGRLRDADDTGDGVSDELDVDEDKFGSEVSSGGDDDDVDDQPESLSKKRGRAPRNAKLNLTPASPPTTRTLRPRRTKTQAQIEEEQEKEDAYRRAVAS